MRGRVHQEDIACGRTCVGRSRPEGCSFDWDALAFSMSRRLGAEGRGGMRRSEQGFGRRAGATPTSIGRSRRGLGTPLACADRRRRRLRVCCFLTPCLTGLLAAAWHVIGSEVRGASHLGCASAPGHRLGTAWDPFRTGAGRRRRGSPFRAWVRVTRSRLPRRGPDNERAIVGARGSRAVHSAGCARSEAAGYGG